MSKGSLGSLQMLCQDILILQMLYPCQDVGFDHSCSLQTVEELRQSIWSRQPHFLIASRSSYQKILSAEWKNLKFTRDRFGTKNTDPLLQFLSRWKIPHAMHRLQWKKNMDLAQDWPVWIRIRLSFHPFEHSGFMFVSENTGEKNSFVKRMHSDQHFKFWLILSHF